MATTKGIIRGLGRGLVISFLLGTGGFQARGESFFDPAPELVHVIKKERGDNDDMKYEKAKTFLESILKGNSWEVQEANTQVNSITPSCHNKTLENEFRSRVCVVLAQLHGQLAERLRMQGISHGKNVFRFIKMAMALDEKNREAVFYHAQSAVGVYDQGAIGRRTAERLLEINLRSELTDAKNNFERLKWTDHDLYRKVLASL